MPRAKILVLDSDSQWTLTLSELLIPDNYEIFSANSLQDATLLLEAHLIDLLIAEINQPQADAGAMLEQLRQMYPQTTLIVLTAKPSVSQAVQATRLGAVEYVEKSNDPVSLASLREKVSKVVQERGTLFSSAVTDPRTRGMLATPVQGFYGIISQNERMRDIFELIQTRSEE